MIRCRKIKPKVKRNLLKLTIGGLYVVLILGVKGNTNETFCLFNDSKITTESFKATNTENIIKVFTISPSAVDPIFINLQRSEGINYNPIVYFAIEGDAAKFIKHINPVQLTSNNPVSVPITIGANIRDYLQLISNGDEIRGKLKLKYLNGFVDEEMELSFTKKYLVSQFSNGIGMEHGGNNGLALSENQMKIVEVVAPHLILATQKLQSENNQLISKLNSANGELGKLQSQSNELINKLNSSNGELGKVQIQNNELTNKLNLTNGELGKLQSQNSELIHKLNSTNKQLEQLNAKVQELQKQLQQQQAIQKSNEGANDKKVKTNTVQK